MLSCDRLAADGSAAYALAAASTRAGSGENSASRAAKNRALSLSSSSRYRSRVILARDTPAASPRSDNNFLQLTTRRRTLSPSRAMIAGAFLNRFEHARE